MAATAEAVEVATRAAKVPMAVESVVAMGVATAVVWKARAD